MKFNSCQNTIKTVQIDVSVSTPKDAKAYGTLKCNFQKVILFRSTLTLRQCDDGYWVPVISLFMICLLFSMFESLPVAVKMYTNYSFFFK